MTRFRRHRALLAAFACVGIAVLLALFAADVASWRSTVERDDLRFRALPRHTGLWRPTTTLPGDPASLVLGTSSTIAWRRAEQFFWFTRTGGNPDVQMDIPTLRAETQDRLLGQMQSAPTSSQRSAAANLLGVLVVTTPVPSSDQDAIAQILQRAASYFQRSIELDSTNLDAKQNLELVLRITRPGKGRLGKDARSGYGYGLGQGANQVGGGY
ncbi:MAG TPA: hypothetical protein VFL60_10460 [Gaiellaceae bacterium]|nr:hypothetical protein [Gaiellaceae bacterium]